MSPLNRSTLPYPPLLVRVVRTSVIVWLLVRIAYVLVLLTSVELLDFLSHDDGIAAALEPVWTSRALLVIVTAFLVWLQRRNAHEHLLQANFGVRPAWFTSASLLAATAADVAVQAIVRSF